MKQIKKAILALDVSSSNNSDTSIRYPQVSFGYVTFLYFFGRIRLYRNDKTESTYIKVPLRNCKPTENILKSEGFNFAQDYSWEGAVYFQTTPDNLIYLNANEAQEVVENINSL